MKQVDIGGNKFWLLNTHLESTAQYKQARVNQLKAAFKHVYEKSSTHSVLFAGDLNLRDSEVKILWFVIEFNLFVMLTI
jgi:endonuclease/exonuclease/phosphatase family metal-dependent hydrolase